MQSARGNIAQRYEFHSFESDTERLSSIDSVLVSNEYLFPVSERVEDGVRGPNPMHSEAKGANKRPA